MIKTEELCKLYSIKDKGKKWYSEDEIIKLINEMIDDVELAGYENPIDEAYHKALFDFKQALLKEDKIK